MGFLSILTFNIKLIFIFNASMGGYSYKSGWGGGRKDKVFLKEILGRIRNFGKKCLFFGGILPILGWF